MDSFQAALSDLLHKKKSRLTQEGVAAAFRAAPAASLRALPALLGALTAEGGRSGAARVAAAELAARLFKAPPEGLAAALSPGGACARVPARAEKTSPLLSWSFWASARVRAARMGVLCMLRGRVQACRARARRWVAHWRRQRRVWA